MISKKLGQYWISISILCSIQLVFGILSLLSGVALLLVAYKDDSLRWPITSGVGVWAGFIVIVSAILGHAVSCVNQTEGKNKREHTYKAHFVFCCLSYISSGLMACYNVWIIVDCQQDSDVPSYCAEDFELKLVIAAASVTLAVGLVIVTLPLSVIYCVVNSRDETRKHIKSSNRIHSWEQ